MSRSATRLAPSVVSVLWVDDKPETITPIKRLLDGEKNHSGIDVQIATTIEQARELLKTSVRYRNSRWQQRYACFSE